LRLSRQQLTRTLHYENTALLPAPPGHTVSGRGRECQGSSPRVASDPPEPAGLSLLSACSTLPGDQAGQSSRFVLFSVKEKGQMVEREVEITEAMVQRLLHAFRRGLKPLTLEEMIEILRNS
jgi:hypothetical protein